MGMKATHDGSEGSRSPVTLTTACPRCGDMRKREIYSIGSGPEVSCDLCSWSWGIGGHRVPEVPTLSVRDYLARIESGSYFHPES